MSNSKVEIKIGDIEFQLEGEPKWVDGQIANLLDRLMGDGTIPAPKAAPKAEPKAATKAESEAAPAAKPKAVKEKDTEAKPKAKAKPKATKAKPTPKKDDAPKAVNTKAKAAAKARVQADADMNHPLVQYLEAKDALGNQVRRFLGTSAFLTVQGKKRLNTAMVAEITHEAGLQKFANASDCLNKNEKKDYCIKEGKEFVVTSTGIKALA